jgi:hypothetical protein
MTGGPIAAPWPPWFRAAWDAHAPPVGVTEPSDEPRAGREAMVGLSDGTGTEKTRPAARGLRRHAIAYAVVNGLAIAINLLTLGSPWAVWLLLGWGIGLAAHALYVKTVSIDDRWATSRAKELQERAYDAGHIEDIECRYRAGRTGDRPARRSPDH